MRRRGGGTNIRKGLDLGAKPPLVNICPVPPPRAVYFNVDRECLGRNADGGTRGINVSGAYNLMFSLTPVPAELTCFIIFFLKNSSHYHPSPASCSQAETCTSQESFSQLQLPALLWFPGLAVKRIAEMPSLRGHFTSLCKGFKIKVRAKQRK